MVQQFIKVNQPLVSICIPTYNRDKFLGYTLESIVSRPIFQNTDKIEIVISNNGSTDCTDEIVRPFLEQFPDKIQYHLLENPVTGDENFIKVLQWGRGKYLKLHNDQLLFLDGAVEKIVELLEQPEVGNVLFFNNGQKTNHKPIPGVTQVNGFEALLNYETHVATWIGALCINREAFQKIEAPGKYSHLHFGQLYWEAEALGKDGLCTIYEEQLFDLHPTFRRIRDYSLPKVFGSDFNRLLEIFVQKKCISVQTKKLMLQWQLLPVNKLFWRETHWNIKVICEYFSVYWPIYKYFPSFYLQAFKMFLSYPCDALLEHTIKKWFPSKRRKERMAALAKLGKKEELREFKID